MTHTINNNDQVIFSVSAITVINGIVSNITEKAIKIDFEMTPVGSRNTICYSKSMWMPKSVVEFKDGYLTVKKWFANKFKEQSIFSIKGYYILNDKKIFY